MPPVLAVAATMREFLDTGAFEERILRMSTARAQLEQIKKAWSSLSIIERRNASARANLVTSCEAAIMDEVSAGMRWGRRPTPLT